MSVLEYLVVQLGLAPGIDLTAGGGKDTCGGHTA